MGLSYEIKEIGGGTQPVHTIFNEIDFKITRLISDSGKEYSEIKKWNNSYKIPPNPNDPNDPGEPNGKFHYYKVNGNHNYHTALSLSIASFAPFVFIC